MAKKASSKKHTQSGKQPSPVKKKTIHKGETSNAWFSKIPFVFLAITAIIVLKARISLLSIPMERDEAGFAYIGHWLWKGKSLYTEMIDNKLPGLYLVYGLFTEVFGYHSTGVHIGLLICNIVSAACFYFLVKELFSDFVAAISTAFLSILLFLPNVVGFAAHATQVLLPFVMGGFLLFWKGIRQERYLYFFLSGLLLGFAFIIKQQSVVFGLLAAIIWWPARLKWVKHQKKNLPIVEWLLLGIGGLLPVGITALIFSMTGRWDDLYFWTYAQPAGMAATFTQSRWELFRNIFPQIIEGSWPIWIIACAGLILAWLTANKKIHSSFAVAVALLGLASVVIGAAFYRHYFILALPGIALLAALSLSWMFQHHSSAVKMSSLFAALILLAWPVLHFREYLFNPDFSKIHQAAYNQNMFPELEKIGEELARRASPGSRIGILGSEPGVLVAADRESCSKHLFMYPLLSDPVSSPPLQTEFTQEMKDCMPDYIVWNSNTGSWTIGYDRLPMFTNLLNWVEKNYTTSAIAEFRPDGPGLILWDEAVQGYQAQSPFKVYVFKKI